jgi:hypothetical protein
VPFQFNSKQQQLQQNSISKAAAMRSQTLFKLQEETEAVLCDYTLRKVSPWQQQRQQQLQQQCCC